MEEKNVQNGTEEKQGEKKEETKMAENENKKEKTEKKKPGKVKAWFKQHKRELIVGGLCAAAGAAGTYGVSELGRRHMAKKNACTPTTEPTEYSPLDPNVM